MGNLIGAAVSGLWQVAQIIADVIFNGAGIVGGLGT
jgi:hypothetical protein